MGESAFRTGPPIFQVPAVIFFGGGGGGIIYRSNCLLGFVVFFPGDVWKTVYHEKFHPFFGGEKILSKPSYSQVRAM